MGHLECEGVNGGNLDELKLDFSQIPALLWIPNIDNSEDKILPRIKAQNRTMLLISSKRCVENRYRESDVVGRLLKTRSNLGIMIEKEDRYRFKLLDPLGNIFCNTVDVGELCQSLKQRVEFLLSRTRSSSLKHGERKAFSISPGFIEAVRLYGDRFAEYVNAINPNRFLGNAATRCSYGFPAHKCGNRIFVSRRDVDKQGISENDFVEIDALVGTEGPQIAYWGDQKPSVDAPIQILLFNQYPNVNYIIHGHVYVKDAPMTENKMPCGALEEFGEILRVLPDSSSANFAVNLRGHGCLILAKDLDYFDQVTLVGRQFPEP